MLTATLSPFCGGNQHNHSLVVLVLTLWSSTGLSRKPLSLVVLMVTLSSSLQVVADATSIAGGGGDDTMVFNSTVGGLFVSLDSGADSVSFVTKVSGATMHGGNGLQTVASVLWFDLVEPSVAHSLEVPSMVGLETIPVSGLQADISNGTSLSGGAGADTISGGAITVGCCRCLLLGWCGNDTFNFGTGGTGNTAGTAYFWNDNLELTPLLSWQWHHHTGGVSLVFFGVTSGASMNISFAAAADPLQQQAFGAPTCPALGRFTTMAWLASALAVQTTTSIAFSGGGVEHPPRRCSSKAAAGTNILKAMLVPLAGTANFGTATVRSRPSADPLQLIIPSILLNKPPLKRGFFYAQISLQSV